MKKRFVSLILFVVIAPVWAATQTVTLSVPGMTCAACPITVKKALAKMPGILEVKVDLNSQSATVTFDDREVTPGQLTEATTHAGYPATVLETVQ